MPKEATVYQKNVIALKNYVINYLNFEREFPTEYIPLKYVEDIGFCMRRFTEKEKHKMHAEELVLVRLLARIGESDVVEEDRDEDRDKDWVNDLD